MDNIGFLVAAYSVFWALIFIYVFSISKRQKSIETEIAKLQEMQEG